MIQRMSKKDFLENIFDYEKNEEWAYQGERPAVIEFYADWCAPCRLIGPILEELEEEYLGIVDFFKVDTETEEELEAAFAIRSIPSILFIPKEGRPLIATGAMPKSQFRDIIESELFRRARV
jgi:thioredoxin